MVWNGDPWSFALMRVCTCEGDGPGRRILNATARPIAFMLFELVERGGPAPIPECLSSRVPQVLCEPGTCVCCARGLSRYSVVSSRSVSSVLDTLTPEFELYVRLRERLQ
ncbi:hypothetical protein Taro_010405 [Colocasia esculenta]|uniref:Uncharacterized protein n=1 Tax=Colocasia esculenta TaxID=4460 RepID=A0A843U6U6_COLES|nr:hypothetical protein [Colocasia esculenta]